MQPPQAPLADFIRQNLELILADWEAMAATMQPAARYMDSRALRNYAAEMLARIAEEMEAGQTAEQQTEKSRGERPGYAPEMTASAHDHAAHRLSDAFTLEQVVAEFRALRASVVRHWTDQKQAQFGRREIEELTRFNEGIDQLLTESLIWYDRMVQITQRRLRDAGVPEPSQSSQSSRTVVADGSRDATLVEVRGAFVYANAAAARRLHRTRHPPRHGRIPRAGTVRKGGPSDGTALAHGRRRRAGG